MATTRKMTDDDALLEELSTPRAELPGERLAAWFITRMDEFQDDRDMAIDGQRILGALPVLSQRYLAMILRDGPLDNGAAARLLKITQADLADAVKRLEAAFHEIMADR